MYDAWKLATPPEYELTLDGIACSECGAEGPCGPDCPTQDVPDLEACLVEARADLRRYLKRGNVRAVAACERRIAQYERARGAK